MRQTDRELAVFPYVIHNLECEIGKLKWEAGIESLKLRLGDYEDVGDGITYTVYWKTDPNAESTFFTSRFFLSDARLQAELCRTQNRDAFINLKNSRGVLNRPRALVIGRRAIKPVRIAGIARRRLRY